MPAIARRFPELTPLVENLLDLDLATSPPFKTPQLSELVLPLTTLSAGSQRLAIPQLSLRKDTSPPNIDFFYAALPPLEKSIMKKADPSGLIFGFLNAAEANAQVVGACFFTWLCVVDDLVEDLAENPFDAATLNLARILRRQSLFSPSPPSSCEVEIARLSCEAVTQALADTIYSTTIGEEITWCGDFVEAIIEILEAFRLERPLLEGGASLTVQQWLPLRMISISLRPFFILLRASYGLSTCLSSCNNPLRLRSENGGNRTLLSDLEATVQLALGLENDIIGWEKDYREQNYLSSVQICLLSTPDAKDALKAVSAVVDVHNQIVYIGASLVERIQAEVKDAVEVEYSASVFHFLAAHLAWAAKAKRYVV